MNVREVALGGRRVVRVVAYSFEVQGEEPQARVLVVGAWKNDPPIPLSEGAVSLPASAVPQLVAALQEVAE